MRIPNMSVFQYLVAFFEFAAHFCGWYLFGEMIKLVNMFFQCASFFFLLLAAFHSLNTKDVSSIFCFVFWDVFNLVSP